MDKKTGIPVYSLDKFKSKNDKSNLFQVELFDANRHFKVSYPHRHDFYEILYLSQGSGVHIIDSNRYAIKPPCVFFLSPGQAHKLELSHDIEGYIFIFTAEFYLLNQKNKNIPKFAACFILQKNSCLICCIYFIRITVRVVGLIFCIMHNSSVHVVCTVYRRQDFFHNL